MTLRASACGKPREADKEKEKGGAVFCKANGVEAMPLLCSLLTPCLLVSDPGYVGDGETSCVPDPNEFPDNGTTVIPVASCPTDILDIAQIVCTSGINTSVCDENTGVTYANSYWCVFVAVNMHAEA